MFFEWKVWKLLNRYTFSSKSDAATLKIARSIFATNSKWLMTIELGRIFKSALSIPDTRAVSHGFYDNVTHKSAAKFG